MFVRVTAKNAGILLFTKHKGGRFTGLVQDYKPCA